MEFWIISKTIHPQQKDSKMLELLLPCLMLYCLFKCKNKIKIFVAWLLLYFIPFFVLVYDGEESNLEMALSMGENISILEWYLGVFMIALMWALMMFAATLMVFLLLRFSWKS